MTRGDQKLAAAPLKCAAVFVAAASLLGLAGCSKLAARDQLNKGVAAYRNAKYEEAIEHFKDAVNRDPQLLNAKLYLATAYKAQYIPGADTPDNVRNADEAIDMYQKVLDSNPGRESKVLALKGIASIYYDEKKMDKSKEYDQKVLEVDPNDPETYYSIGVIDWGLSYQKRMAERAKIGLKPTDPLKDKKVCALLKQANGQVIDEGMNMLSKAIELRPEYDDAMAYLNLMYREKADTECENPDQQTADLKTADDWLNKSMATKKEREEKKKGPGGIVLDQPGNQQQQQ